MDEKRLAEIRRAMIGERGGFLPWASYCDQLLEYIDAQAERIRELEAEPTEYPTTLWYKRYHAARQETATAIAKAIKAAPYGTGWAEIVDICRAHGADI